MSQRNPTRDWWIASTQHRTHKGEVLDFLRHPYQPAILRDPAQHKIIKKATQCGISELEICHATSLVDQGRNVFWVFPDQDLRNMFIKDRIDLSLSNSPHYQMLVARASGRFQGGKKDATDEVRIKQIGTASICFVGSNSIASFKSFTADDAIIDEFDQCNARNLTMVPDRFAHSQYRTTWKVGNPTISGYGIDALYADSDRKHWFIRCEHCNEQQPLDWFVNIVRETSEGMYELRATLPDGQRGDDLLAFCRRCERSLNRLSNGEWVAECPGHSVSGYQINQIFSGSLPLREMWDSFTRGLANETEAMRFMNSALGLPYESKGSKLSEAILNQCVGEHPQTTTGHGCYMGADVGSLIHVTVFDPAGKLISIRAVRTIAECDEIMAAFRVQLCVMDALPETRIARGFAERHTGRVLLCTFVKSDKVQDFSVDYDAMRVVADRTQTLDESHAAIWACKACLPRDAASVPDFYAQMIAPTRIFDESKQVFRWVEGNQADHYRHAFNYGWLARSIDQRTGGQTVWAA